MRSKTRTHVRAGEAAAASPQSRSWNGRRSSKDSRREQILRSVGDVLVDTGLSSLSMLDISRRLGITKGNLYYYFNDKQDILYQCHMLCMDVSLEALASLDPAQGPAERLHTLLSRHIRGIIDGGLRGVLLTDLESLNPEQRKTYVARRDQFESGVRSLITEGVASGEFDCGNIKLASLTMLGAINWLPKWYRADGPMGSEAIADGMADFLLRAVRAERAVRAVPRSAAKPGVHGKAVRKAVAPARTRKPPGKAGKS